MILLKNYLEAIEYKITDGTDYGWQCYGSNARYLDSYKEDQYSVGAIFDSQDQFVYAIELWDYQNNREYRWQHPDYKQAFLNEAKEREIDPTESLDNSKFIDLEVADDILEKISAVVAGEDYDTRVKVPVDFTDEQLLTYMKMAHERDITFNQLVEEALRHAIAEVETGRLTKEDAQNWLEEKELREELDNIYLDDKPKKKSKKKK